MEVVNETVAESMVQSDGDLPPHQSFDCSYGSYGVLVIVLLFQFINWIIKSVGPPKSLRDDEWKWRNLAISWLHALVCDIWSITCLVTEPELLLDLQHYKTNKIFFLLIFTSGYFLYDFLDLALNGKMISMWEVQLHHIAVGGMFYYNLVRCEWMAFNIIALLVEINSFFLHQRKLLQMVGTPYSSKLYRVTIFLNISTFVIFRAIPLAAILWAMTQWYHRVSWIYFISLGSAMCVMVIMNPILFMRLLRSDYLRDNSKRSAKSSHIKVPAANGNNNLPNNNCHNHVKSS